MLMKLERDRVKAKNEAIEAQMKAMQVSRVIRMVLMERLILLIAPQSGRCTDVMPPLHKTFVEHDNGDAPRHKFLYIAN